jgi:hypothetical protein
MPQIRWSVFWLTEPLGVPEPKVCSVGKLTQVT